MDIKTNLTPQQEVIAEELITRAKELENARVLENLRDRLDDILSIAGLADEKDYIITIRYKAPDRIREKLERKGYDAIDKMQDLAGATIVLKNKRNMQRVKKLIQKNFTVKHVSDYSKDSERAYNGINMNLADVEIQIKDSMEYFLGFWDHDSIYKNPDIEKKYRDRLSKKFRSNIEAYIKKNNVDIDFSSNAYAGIIQILKDTIREVFRVPLAHSVKTALRRVRIQGKRVYKAPKETRVPVSEEKREKIEKSAVQRAKKQR